MASESGVTDDVVSLLKRLDSAVSSREHESIKEHLSALENLSVTVSVLQRTKCGIAVSKLRTHEHAECAKLAGAITRKWKRVAEEAGMSRRPDAASAPRGDAQSSAGGSILPLVSPSAPSSQQSGASQSLSSAAASGKGSGAGAVAGGSASRSAPGKLEASALPPLPPLPPSRARPRQLLIDLFQKAAKELQAASSSVAAAAAAESGGPTAAAAAASASSSCSQEESEPSSPLASPSPAAPALSSEEVQRQAMEVASRLEAALFSMFGGPLSERPAAAYSERFRSLAMALPRNVSLALNVFTGLTSVEDLARLSGDDLVSEDARSKAAAMRKEALESVQLDWKEKNKKAVLASAGLKSGEGTFKCGKCGSRNTDYTQKQTRSADEPMTTFGVCNDCGNRWKFS